MSIFDFAKKLFSRPKDPTQDWPESTITALSPINLHDFSIGEFRFNDGVEKCRFLGRCTKFELIGEGNFDLFYEKIGVHLEFEQGKFYFFGFIPGDGGSLQVQSDLVLTSNTTTEEVKKALGAPRDEDADEDEIVLYYRIGETELEFELTAQGRLERFNIYLDD